MSAPWRIVLAETAGAVLARASAALARDSSAHGRRSSFPEVAASRRCTVRTASFLMSAVMAPRAHSVPGERGTKTGGMPTSRGQEAGHDRAGAAEGDQREVARIEAGRARMLVKAAYMFDGRAPRSPPRRRVHVDAERIGRAAAWPRRPVADGAASGRRGSRRGRGSRRPGRRRRARLVAAAAVAGRAGIGARALRADLQARRPRRPTRWSRRPRRSTTRPPPAS